VAIASVSSDHRGNAGDHGPGAGDTSGITVGILVTTVPSGRHRRQKHATVRRCHQRSLLMVDDCTRLYCSGTKDIGRLREAAAHNKPPSVHSLCHQSITHSTPSNSLSVHRRSSTTTITITTAIHDIPYIIHSLEHSAFTLLPPITNVDPHLSP
jgi:hypothetical protein